MLFNHGDNMNTHIKFFVAVLCLGTVGCASVGGAWNAGTEIVTGTVDSVVGGAATMAVAVTNDAKAIADVTINTAQGVVETVANEVDKQTDELQKEPEAPKKD